MLQLEGLQQYRTTQRVVTSKLVLISWCFNLLQLLQTNSSLPIDEVEYLDLSRKDIGMEVIITMQLCSWFCDGQKRNAWYTRYGLGCSRLV